MAQISLLVCQGLDKFKVALEGSELKQRRVKHLAKDSSLRLRKF